MNRFPCCQVKSPEDPKSTINLHAQDATLDIIPLIPLKISGAPIWMGYQCTYHRATVNTESSWSFFFLET